MDDISQVVQMEYKGTYYVLKGTTKVISYFAKAIKALGEFIHKKYQERPGACTWNRLQELSEGNPIVLEFPIEMLEEKMEFPNEDEPVTMFEHYCNQNGLHYTILPDFNPNDDYVPVGILSQDMAIHEEHIKSVMNKRIESQESKNKSYSELLSELETELVNETDNDKREKLEVQIENVKEAMKQNEDLLSESKDKMEKNNVIDFVEYLKQGEDTNFSDNPDIALEDMEEQGILKDLEPKECMMPIRDKNLVPESKEIYYTQVVDDNVYSIQRTFNEDENGIVYSDYRVVDPNNPQTPTEFTDKDMTSKEFEKSLPNLLSDAGVSADEPTVALRDRNHYMAYLGGLNFYGTQEAESKNLGFSSEEAKEFIEKEVENEKTRKAYDKSRERTFIVSMDKVMLNDENSLVVEVDDGLLQGANVTFTDDDEAQVTISKDKEYNLINGENKEKVTGNEVLSNFTDKTDSKTKTKAKVR